MGRRGMKRFGFGLWRTHFVRAVSPFVATSSPVVAQALQLAASRLFSTLVFQSGTTEGTSDTTHPFLSMLPGRGVHGD